MVELKSLRTMMTAPRAEDLRGTLTPFAAWDEGHSVIDAFFRTRRSDPAVDGAENFVHGNNRSPIRMDFFPGESRMRRMICLVFVLLAGCTTTDQAPPTTTLTGNSNGLMIVSLTITPTRGHPLHWHLYDVARKGERLKNLVGYAGTSSEDWAPGDRFDVMGGRLVVQELPPGTYELGAWRFTERLDDQRTRTYWSNTTLPFRFRVEAGRGVYLGNLNLHAEYQATSFPLRVFDARERDLTLFHSRYPGIAPGQIDLRLFPGAQALPPFLRDDRGSKEDYEALVRLLKNQ